MLVKKEKKPKKTNASQFFTQDYSGVAQNHAPHKVQYGGVMEIRNLNIAPQENFRICVVQNIHFMLFTPFRRFIATN